MARPLPDGKAVERMIRQLQTRRPLSTLMVQRGIDTIDKAQAHFCPSLNQLYDPFLMKGMEDAVMRLDQARADNQAILVYGDYDVDGATSVALMASYLRTRGYARVEVYVPDRKTEGYGISVQGVDYAIERNIDLIVALDCGIKAVAPIRRAQEAGLDVIVCDHHLPGEDMPPAYAILNPKQAGCGYPFQELCGCAIGFKLIQALERQAPPEMLQQWLDLVAVAIAADIVPMRDENRILCYYGLEQLNHHPRPGLQALIDIAGLHGPLQVSDLVFRIGPRINAAGRIQHARMAVDLLMEEDSVRAQQRAQTINDNNTVRQSHDQEMTREALEALERMPEDRMSTVLFNPQWHKGVIGIVASRLIETYYRPTVLLTQGRDRQTAVGSARSVEGFNLYEALKACAPLLHQYGGHPMAAGLQLPVAHIPAFQEAFEAAVRQRITPEQRIPKLYYDLTLPLSEVDIRFLNTLNRFGPFGPENQRPLFVSRHLPILEYKVLKEKHLRLIIQAPEGRISAIGFGLAGLVDVLHRHTRFDLCYTIEDNYFRQQRKLQLRIKDIRPSYETIRSEPGQSLWRTPGGERREFIGRARRNCRPAGPQRRRQNDFVLHDRRVHSAQQGPDIPRSKRNHPGADVQTRTARHRLPPTGSLRI